MELFVVVVLAITTAALLVFSKSLYSTTERLERVGNDHAKQLDRLVETIDRMEAATVVVADNLASSVSRADATEGPEGAAADAALRTGDTAEAIHARQDAE